jgi:lycopene cyclase domain-containing protein
MTRYTLYNLVLAVLILAVSYLVAGYDDRKRNLLISARISLILTVLLYPWDFFAVRLGVWTYPNYDGLRIYGVPFNDSIFIWLCSFLACVILITVDRRHSQGKGHPKCKEAASESARK